MNIAHDESTPWGPARNVRGGRIVFKELLRGEEKTPTNFSLVLADTDVTFKSPRHRHNFDQIRITLEGSTNFGPRHNIEVGDIAYFPEGTAYGPQNQELVGKGSVAMVIQFGGASGNGYMSQRQLFEGQEQMRAFGDFEGGVFRRKAAAPDGRMNQDAYEAIWEHQNGRPVEYPKPRMTEPVHFRAANLPWIEVPGQPRVQWKELGSFTERNVRLGCLRLDAGATFSAEPQPQEQIVFVTEGSGRFGSGETWSRYTAAHLAANEAPSMTADTATEALVLFLPRF
jgi:quercetin dioxygenase-like cupin family protein